MTTERGVSAILENGTVRSYQLLVAGLAALERHDLDAAEAYMVALLHEGDDRHYRELFQALLRVAAT